jgi:hypothetical protein
MIVEPVDESASQPRFDLMLNAPTTGEWWVKSRAAWRGAVVRGQLRLPDSPTIGREGAPTLPLRALPRNGSATAKMTATMAAK